MQVDQVGVLRMAQPDQIAGQYRWDRGALPPLSARRRKAGRACLLSAALCNMVTGSHVRRAWRTPAQEPGAAAAPARRSAGPG